MTAIQKATLTKTVQPKSIPSTTFVQQQATAMVPSSSSSLGLWAWDWYKGMARNHRLTLNVLDETLSRLLFWIPHSADVDAQDNDDGTTTTSVDSAWREVGYGILSLHRLSMHLALEDDDCSNNNNNNNNHNNTIRKRHYGMSIRTKNPPTMRNATSARICLTVIHSLMPSLISLMVLRSKGQQGYTKTNNTSIAAAVSRTRLVLEQAKFLLRVSLLVQYWRQQQQPQQCIDSTMTNDSNGQADFGIMLDGGLYHSDQRQESIGIPWDHAMALQRRRNYVGERTGWKTAAASCSSDANGIWSKSCSKITKRLFGDNSSNLMNIHYKNAKTVVAELLYVARPLLWAWFESRYHAVSNKAMAENHDMIRQWSLEAASLASNEPILRPSRPSSLFRGWLVCLIMDVLSIRLLQEKSKHGQKDRYRASQYTASSDLNPFTKSEIRRRKLRLLLYLLRSPVWSRHTLPTLDGLSNKVLRKLPLVGNVLETVLWDWVLYYQHPFVSEEG